MNVLKFNLGLLGLKINERLTPKKDVDDAYLKGVTDAKNEIEKQLVVPIFNIGECQSRINLDN